MTITTEPKDPERTRFAAGRSQEESAYLPIEDYGVIGDLLTVALVGLNGSIDWYCLPHFDSPSIFGAILDHKKGGYFKIAPTIPVTHKQMYFPDTNVLQTRFLSPAGVGEVTDFMPVELHVHELQDKPEFHQIYRRVKVVRGEMAFRMECFPAFNYARDSHKTHLRSEGALFTSSSMAVALHSPVPLKTVNSGVVAEFKLKAGEAITFVLKQAEEADDGELTQACGDGRAAFDQTVEFWRNWIGHTQYKGRWREMVNRSALTLKMLTYAPTGAIVAAPTAGLPEFIAGVRNWDYRYMWIRDASFTVYAFLRLGFTKEAAQFMKFVHARIQEIEPDGRLQIIYGINGKHDLDEKVLSHLEGYRGSKPVTIGNAAHKQLQLDIYGELIDSVYLYNKYGAPISYELWNNITRLLDYVCENWRLKDEGIWEVRSEQKHFVYSKVMCWVALDRGLRLAQQRSFPADWHKWRENRDLIFREVMEKGWNDKKQSFVQHYDTDQLDAANLIMPLVKFISPTDPRMLSTLERSSQELVSDTLVHRYVIGEKPEDGIAGKEGTFSMCTFWYAEALARAGKVHEARYVFETMLTYANHLGLYSEQIGQSGESLGNIPQAFTHLGLISAAFNLDRIMDEKSWV